LSLRSQLLVSLVLQGTGAASILLVTLWLGVSLGPEVQGGFSRLKSEIEFVAALAMFGLPQALFFYVKSNQLSGVAALRWAWGSALVAVLIGCCYGAVQHAQRGGGFVLLLSMAIAAGVAHGQLRALLLVLKRTEWFNVLTALPQILMLAGVALYLTSGMVCNSWSWVVLFAVSYAAAAMCAGWRLQRHMTMMPPTPAIAGWRELGRYGFASWLTAVLSTAAILLAQHGVDVRLGPAALGQFTMAMTLLQIPLTPINYAVPLLFRRWMERSGAHDSRRWAAALFVVLLGLAAVVCLASLWWSDLWLGRAYDGTTQALAVLLVGAGAEAATRMLAVQASAAGRPWITVHAELARWAVLAAGWFMPVSGLLSGCFVWAAAAGAAALVLIVSQSEPA
jgi:O-antigen/teichoic acid export membrane protein